MDADTVSRTITFDSTGSDLEADVAVGEYLHIILDDVDSAADCTGSAFFNIPESVTLEGSTSVYDTTDEAGVWKCAYYILVDNVGTPANAAVAGDEVALYLTDDVADEPVTFTINVQEAEAIEEMEEEEVDEEEEAEEEASEDDYEDDDSDADTDEESDASDESHSSWDGGAVESGLVASATIVGVYGLVAGVGLTICGTLYMMFSIIPR